MKRISRESGARMNYCFPSSEDCLGIQGTEARMRRPHELSVASSLILFRKVLIKKL